MSNFLFTTREKEDSRRSSPGELGEGRGGRKERRKKKNREKGEREERETCRRSRGVAVAGRDEWVLGRAMLLREGLEGEVWPVVYVHGHF